MQIYLLRLVRSKKQDNTYIHLKLSHPLIIVYDTNSNFGHGDVLFVI